jgi:hypothetical protein
MPEFPSLPPATIRSASCRAACGQAVCLAPAEGEEAGMPGFVMVMHFLPAQGRFRAIAHGRSLPQVSPSAVFVLSMAGGGHRVRRTDPAGTKSMPRGAGQGAGMDVTAPSRSPRRHMSPACHRRGFPSFPANDGTYSNSGMQSGSGTLVGHHCRSQGTRAYFLPAEPVSCVPPGRLSPLRSDQGLVRRGLPVYCNFPLGRLAFGIAAKGGGGHFAERTTEAPSSPV